jgi:hypothetical protein
LLPKEAIVPVFRYIDAPEEVLPVVDLASEDGRISSVMPPLILK